MTFSAAESWVLVLDEEALPLGKTGLAAPVPGRVLIYRPLEVAPSAHTLRELESADCGVAKPDPKEAPEVGLDSRTPAALCFQTADFPPGPGETVASFCERLVREASAQRPAPELLALRVADSSELERPELSRHIPADARRLLDVGCGAGGASAAVRRARPGLFVTGVEKDSAAAEKARGRLDRVLEGSAQDVFLRLAAAGETFDAFLFGDILEHLADPVAAIALARSMAAPGATLVASVPNVGHLSLVRDLLLGRFDPAPAGLTDAGHLRWFTRDFLSEALEEAGWRVGAIESVRGAAAPGADEFLARFDDWPDLARDSLQTYQWIAVATAQSGPEVSPHHVPLPGGEGEYSSGERSVSANRSSHEGR